MPSYTSISENLDLKLIRSSSFTFWEFISISKIGTSKQTPIFTSQKNHQKPQSKNHHNNQTKKTLKAQKTPKNPNQTKKPLEQSLEKNHFKGGFEVSGREVFGFFI